MRIPRVKKHPRFRKARKFKNFENHLFLNDLEASNLDEIKNITKDPDQMWSLWRNLFLGVLDKHAPITEIKNQRQQFTICNIKSEAVNQNQRSS